MAILTQYADLNLIPKFHGVPVVHIKQYDKVDREITCKIFNGSSRVTNLNTSGVLAVKRPDGTLTEIDCSYSTADNTFTFPCTEQLTIYSGKVFCSMFWQLSEDERISTEVFIIDIQKHPMQEDEEITVEEKSLIETWDDKIASINETVSKYVIDDAMSDSSTHAVQNKVAKAYTDIRTPFVTPEMYGAVGDGETDDSEALQNALNSGLPVKGSKTYKVHDIIFPNFGSLDDGKYIVPENGVGFKWINQTTGSTNISNCQIYSSNYNAKAFYCKGTTSTTGIWSINFYNVKVVKFEYVFYVEGDASGDTHNLDGYCSEILAVGCKFYDNDCEFYCNNNQSVDNTFVDCSCEHDGSITYKHDLFHIYAGALNVIDSSVIAGEGRKIVNFDYEKPFPYARVNFSGSRFELKFANQGYFDYPFTNNASTFDIYIDNCFAYVPNEDTKLFDFDGKGEFHISNTTFSNTVVVYTKDNTYTHYQGTPYSKLIGNGNTNFKVKSESVFDVLIESDCKIEQEKDSVIDYSVFNGNLVPSRIYSPRAMTAGIRIGELKITAPNRLIPYSFGLLKFGNASSETYTLKLYAIVDGDNAWSIANGTLLGSLSGVTGNQIGTITNFLNDARSGMTDNYTYGKYLLTATVDGQSYAPTGKLWVEFR